MTPHHIRLQSSIGDFSPDFVKALPALEKTMTDHGIDPSNFVIAKDMARVTPLPFAYRPDGNSLEYTVFVKGRSFTVTQPNDMSFLAYFYSLCAPPEHKDAPHSIAHAVHTEEKKLEALIARLETWFNKPI
ncbi:MAG TPA: hypothetical protein VFC45_10515 [Pseudolabrys sp.]|nr:hypothetical protein [Pseudolabrys sp.]